MNGPVLVTGAGGKTGRAVIAALTARGGSVRALVRDVDRHADLAHLADGAPDGAPDGEVDAAPDADPEGLPEGLPDSSPDVEVVRGDQREVDDLVAALDGCVAVYAIAPNVSPLEQAMARAVLAACQRTGVRRLVFHSVIHPQLSAMPHHGDKAAAEEAVVESGLDWTILQPNAYLQNLAGYLGQLRSGSYRVPYAADAGLALVDLRDVADVAARCLLGHLGVHASFELSGPQEVSPNDVARVAGEILGRAVIAQRQDPDAWAGSAASATDLPEASLQRLHAMFLHYDRHGSPGDATVLRALLGREPGGLRAYLAEELG